MTGMFELFTGSDAFYRFRLTAPDGTVMAFSRPFPDKASAVAGISAVREYAGMGLVTEIPVPQDAAEHQSGAVPVLPGSGARKRAAREGQEGPDGARASGAGARLPRFRLPSAAHFLGRRAVARTHRPVLRWRQTPVAGTAPAGLSPC